MEFKTKYKKPKLVSRSQKKLIIKSLTLLAASNITKGKR